MSILKLSMALAASFAAASGAHAAAITVSAADLNKTYTVNYDGSVEGQNVSGLSGQTAFTLTGVTGTSYTFSYSVANTSGDPLTSSRISLFGFNTNPDISGATSTGTFNQTATNSNAPNGIGTVEVCFKGGGGPNCSGGGSGGVNLGDSTTGTLTLNFAQAPAELTLSDFFVRYQAINGPGMRDESGTGTGTISSTSSGGSTSTGGSTSSGGHQVPAPAGFALFALAAAGLAFGQRLGRRPLRAA